MRNRSTIVHGASALENCIQDPAMTAFKVALRLCGNEEEAKELVQEAAYRILRHWNRYDPAKPFNNWFFAVMRNAFLDSRQRFETRRVISLDAPMDENGGNWAETLCSYDETPLEQLEREETIQSVRKAMNSLNRNHRTILTLCYMEGLQKAEIARSFNMPPGTVGSRLCRARKALHNQAPELAALA